MAENTNLPSELWDIIFRILHNQNLREVNNELLQNCARKYTCRYNKKLKRKIPGEITLHKSTTSSSALNVNSTFLIIFSPFFLFPVAPAIGRYMPQPQNDCAQERAKGHRQPPETGVAPVAQASQGRHGCVLEAQETCGASGE